jgi:hypothetical protein
LQLYACFNFLYRLICGENYFFIDGNIVRFYTVAEDLLTEKELQRMLNSLETDASLDFQLTPEFEGFLRQHLQGLHQNPEEKNIHMRFIFGRIAGHELTPRVGK